MLGTLMQRERRDAAGLYRRVTPGTSEPWSDRNKCTSESGGSNFEDEFRKTTQLCWVNSVAGARGDGFFMAEAILRD